MRLPSEAAPDDFGVREIARLVAARELSPVDLVESLLSRIGAIEGSVHAWSLLDAAGAREQARALEQEAAAKKLRGPLHGVPVGIKDEFHVSGLPTGMRDWEGPPQVEREDATCVARLRAAGAIIMGKTHMVVNGKIPPTRNPWNLDHTAGGTSSGSGAAVGARMVPFAIGEQTVGSNLRPAAYCGVDAMKPTYGRISRFGCYPFIWSLDHVGIIALDMEDVALVLSVIAGPDSRDPTTLALPAPEANLHLETVEPPRVGLVRNFYPERTEPVMQESLELAARRLADAGATVVDAFLPEEFGLTWKLRPLFDVEMYLFHNSQAAQSLQAPRYTPKPSDLVPATYYVQARRVRAWLAGQLNAFIGDYDAVLMPATPGPAPKGTETTGDAMLLAPWSLLGLPAITINAGLSPDGLPLGLQLVAPRLKDHELMRVGAWCERVLGRLRPPAVSGDSVW
jgi:aspartyl-tRNA(Asn)/glutamyl-tRNA(Gln) amidotransferase subunit A